MSPSSQFFGIDDIREAVLEDEEITNPVVEELTEIFTSLAMKRKPTSSRRLIQLLRIGTFFLLMSLKEIFRKICRHPYCMEQTRIRVTN